jgi:hypothetical protein
VAERQQQRAARHEAFGQKVLHGGKDGDEAAFVVEGTATPHLTFQNGTGKGGLAPRVVGTRIDGNDVLMGDEHDRRQFGSATAPGVEQTPITHALALEGGVDAREQRPQLCV